MRRDAMRKIVTALVLGVVLTPLAATAQEAGSSRIKDALRVYPETQSTFAQEVDNLNNFINIVTIVCFVGIILFMAFFAVKYRRRDPHQKALSQVSHNTLLELSWSAPPLVIVMVMFYLGFEGFLKLNTPPNNAYTVNVKAMKWSWSFQHPFNQRIDAQETIELAPNTPLLIDGKPVEIPSILHIPAGEPVVFELTSEDVLHSMSVPAFRIKKDAVPGRKTRLWAEAIDPTPGYFDPHTEVISRDDPNYEAKMVAKYTKLLKAVAGAHKLYCAEFCGTDHSKMRAVVVVHPKGWRPADEPMPETHPEKGRYLFDKKYGCNNCHQTTKGMGDKVGPTLLGKYGTIEKLKGGGTVTVDPDYIRESILTPRKRIVEGYSPVMSETFGKMPEDHIEAITYYIESLAEAAPESK